MYLDKISLRNIRGFEKLDLSLERGDGRYAGWTVFTGGNGSGKSTLLKAIALGLVGNDAALRLERNFNRWIREGCNEAEVTLGIKYDGEPLYVGAVEHPVRYLESHYTLENGGNRSGLANYHLEFTTDSGVYKLLRDEKQLAIWHHMFCCGYGPSRRISGASQDAENLMGGHDTKCFATLFDEAASLLETDKWLRELRFKQLEGKSDEAAKLDLVLEILRDDLLPNHITVDRVDSSGLWLKDCNGVPLTWRDMSDGYRSALALLSDILRHIIDFNQPGPLTARDANNNLVVTQSGVVLIDEIDAHLHPEWQREIGFWLKRHFPNIQFLVTTHSPIICQAADPNGLFVLPEPGSADQPRALTPEEYTKVIVARPDTILLSAAFGLENTRSPQAVENRARFSRLRAKERAGATLTKEELAEIDNLRPYSATGEEP